MKIAYCVRCGDFVTPRRDWETNRAWRWCACDQMGVRWRDGNRGLLQVTSVYGPPRVRVLGLNNGFLLPAVDGLIGGSGEDPDEDWRVFHDLVAEQTPAGYLFSERHRECWAVLIRIGETSDVEFVSHTEAKQPVG